MPSKIATARSRPAELSDRFQEMIQADFAALLAGTGPDLGETQDYAERLHVHPTHLSNSIKQATGRSSCDLLNELYLNEAKRLLRETTLPVAEISQRLAFQEATNFAKYFKKHVGLSPTLFRKQEL